MDLNLLTVFVAVAEHHSFTQAAEALGMQRSAVSRRVAKLEEELGVQLLIRSTRHVAVSTAGQRLLADVAPLLGRLEAAVHELPEASSEPAGELRITAPADLGLWLLPPVLGALTRRHPALHPIVHLGNRVVDLEREGFDVALRVAMSGLPDSNLKARRLGLIHVGLYASPDWVDLHGPIHSLDDLEGHGLVGVSLAVPGPFRNQRTVAANDMLFAAALARHGVGPALLPTFLAADSVSDGSLVPLLEQIDFGAGELYALFPGARELPPKSTAFRDAVLDWLDEHPLP